MDKLFLEWLDVDARFLRAANYVATSAAVAAFLAAIQSASNAGLAISTQGPAAFPAGAPTDAQYPSSLDTAVCNFAVSPSGTVILTIPAPKAAVFLADNETVDPADPTGVLAAAAAALGDVLGNPISGFRSGVRAQRRKDLA